MTKKIPGYTRECPGCSHPRPKKVNFYHSNPPTEATPEQAALFGTPDPNWYCNYCESGNKQEDTRCWKCGAGREKDSEVHEVRTYRASEGLPYSSEDAKRMAVEIPAEKQQTWEPKEDLYNPQTEKTVTNILPKAKRSAPPSSPPTSLADYIPDKNVIFVAGGIALGVIVLTILIWAFFFKTHTEIVSVTAMSWSQNVHIEELQTFHEGGWSVPSGGRETDHYRKKSGDKKVHDGYHDEPYTDTCYDTRTVPDTCTGTRSVPDTCYRDNGDGSSESYSCSSTESYTYSCTSTESYSYSCTKTRTVEDYHYEDVFDTWFEYDIDRWTNIKDYPTSGQGKNIFYDEVQPRGDLQRRVEDGGKYSVTFSNDKREFTNFYDLTGYLLFDYGQDHEIVVNAVGVILEMK